MLDLIPPMVSVLLSWLLLLLLFCGLGAVASRALNRPLAGGWNWLDSFWLGWALSLAVMQVWHFFFPVNDALLLIFAFIAAFMLVRHRRDFELAIGQLLRHKPFLLLIGLLALFFANRALGMPIAYDTGYRDIQAVKWIDAFPIVPGLGNLFSSLAFNQSVYLYDALLDASIWSGRSIYIATGLLLFVYLAYALTAAFQLFRWRRAADLRWSRICAALTVPFILFQTVRWGGITHFLTDTAVDLIGFMTLIYMLDFLQFWRRDCPSGDYLVFRLAFIILTGFTVKQSFIVYGLATALLAISLWLRRGGMSQGARTIRRTIAPLVLAALALMLPWMARGVVTSGYIAYPHTFGRIDLDWTMPEDQIESRQQQLATNTRQRGGDPSIVLASWDWLGPWLRDFAGNIFPTLLPALVTVGALIMYLAAGRKPNDPGRANALRWWALLPMAVMLVFWFFTVPNDKYVRYIFWSLAALSTTMAVLAWHWIAWRRRVLAVYAIIMVCLAYVVFLIVKHEEFLVTAGPNDGFHALIQSRYDVFATADGALIHYPTALNQCWDVPLPCTPLPHEGIESRVPGELRHGFRFVAPEAAG